MYYIDRQTVITLKCDPTTNGTKPTGFKGKESGQLTTYVSIKFIYGIADICIYCNLQVIQGSRTPWKSLNFKIKSIHGGKSLNFSANFIQSIRFLSALRWLRH